MLGPEVLDTQHHPEIVFKSTGAEATGPGQWTVRGNLTLCGQTRPVTVHATLKDGHYTGESTVKQSDFGIKPPGMAGVKTKDEVSHRVRRASGVVEPVVASHDEFVINAGTAETPLANPQRHWSTASLPETVS